MNTVINKAYLLTGSNMGNREESLKTAMDLVEQSCGLITKTSLLYETEAWGKTDQPAFLNQALEMNTSLNAKQLMRCILRVEKKMGRARKEKYDPRIIDIDILLFNDETYKYHFLQVPHPELQNRRFALLPLSEIAKELEHPILKKTIGDLLIDCPDKLEVKIFK